MGTFCRYNDSLYLAIKMPENEVDHEEIDDNAVESSMMKELDDTAARYVEQNDAIVREMNELKDELEKQQAVEQEDPFFIPFIIAGVAKAAAIAAKAALAAKAARATALAVKVAKAAKGAAALAKAAKVAKAAKMAKYAAKAAKYGKKAWKFARKSRYIRKAARYGRKFARSRSGRFVKRAGRRALRAGKKALKRRIKQEVNKWVDNYVEENFPALKPYMKDIKGVLNASRKGTRGLKRFLINKAKAKVNQLLREKGLPTIPKSRRRRRSGGRRRRRRGRSSRRYRRAEANRALRRAIEVTGNHVADGA